MLSYSKIRPVSVSVEVDSTRCDQQELRNLGLVASTRPSTSPRGEVELEVVKMKKTDTGHSSEVWENKESNIL